MMGTSHIHFLLLALFGLATATRAMPIPRTADAATTPNPALDDAATHPLPQESDGIHVGAGAIIPPQVKQLAGIHSRGIAGINAFSGNQQAAQVLKTDDYEKDAVGLAKDD